MKKNVIFFVILFSLYNYLHAQQPDPKASTGQPAIPTFKVALIVEDIMFAATAITTVEISGSDVDAYLQTKNSLLSVVKYIQTNNSRMTDTLTLDIQFPVGQNLLNLMSKAKFQGAQADNYKRFIEAIVVGLNSGKPKENKIK